jgi:hypothetical protein
MEQLANPTMQLILLALNGLLAVVGVLVGYMLRSVLERVTNLERADKALAEEITKLAIAMPTHYVSKPEHETAQNAILEYLRRIEDKLDRKQDKP